MYQFLGGQRVYFYGPAEMAMFMAQQGREPSLEAAEGELQLPKLIVNNHILFLNRKQAAAER